MCTRAAAELQQVCAESYSLIHTLLVLGAAGVSGAQPDTLQSNNQRCCFRMSPQKIEIQLSLSATCRSLPMVKQSSGTRMFPNFSCAQPYTLKAYLHSRSSEIDHTLACVEAGTISAASVILLIRNPFVLIRLFRLTTCALRCAS